ncbi:MAG: sugar phosphate isomerase/epimerase family protein [Candidatus Altiarchaeota archaeon]
MQVAVSTSHRIHLSAEQAVCESYPLGFTDIQLGTPHYSVNIEALNILREKLGLTYTVHAPFPAARGFIANSAAKDEETFLKSKDIFLKSIDNAKSIGAEIVVVHSAEPGPDNNLESTLKMISSLADRGEANGQIICVENKMPNSSVGYSPKDMQAILEDVGSENVGICFDTGHAIASLGSERKALEFMSSFAKWIRDVHIVPGTYEWDVATPPQMEPQFYRGVVKILDQAGYCGNLTIETVPEISDSEIIRGAQYLRATIAEYYEGQIL